MNLRTQISDRLWEAIASAYEAGNYAHAVLEAVHVITEVLREKSGLDGDGNQLVGQALGGDSPKIRLNSLQTDTERNIQKGFESILRGMYSAIRNPRSHESASDKREHADAIICFVNYLLTVLDASKEAFTVESFMERVADPDFVDTTRYAELLVNEIPQGRRGDALIAVFQQRRALPLQKRRSLIDALVRGATDQQVASLLAVISDVLRVTNEPIDIRTTLQFMKPEMWPRLSEPARLRIEHKLLAAIRKGKVHPDGSTNEPLATWANDFLKMFASREDAASIMYVSLYSDDAERRQYIASFFFAQLPAVCTTEQEVKRIVNAIASAIRGGDQHVRTALLRYIDIFPDAWQKALVERLQDLTDKDKAAHILPDGTPFLTADADDDIPF